MSFLRPAVVIAVAPVVVNPGPSKVTRTARNVPLP